ncbi:MAG: carbon-nitrogen hydrolase family protein [Phycisphaeraceae bacterium]|nr:MAG: carbon-nitrogen hydrolase family protein [Phycisphaeraceae bacterium]
MRIAIAQIAPVFLDRAATCEKAAQWIRDAAAENARLVCFGETLVPAYPLWLDRTDGARFESDLQKQFHARYLDQAVDLEAGDLATVQAAAKKHGVNVVIGVAERPRDRGGHTIFCSRVFINETGAIASVHRKLMPTYEERLAWGVGDGAGLVTHRIDEFTVGALNCWENWIPLARAALHAQGEDLHIALWPGAERLTRDSTRFFALEGRSFVISASCIIREQDLPADLPERIRIAQKGEVLYSGGSCVAAPDGSWLVEPVVNEERLIIADLDHAHVRRERQNFDPAGHYTRPDVLRLTVDRRRQAAAEFLD